MNTLEPLAFASARLHILARLCDRVHARQFRRLSNLNVHETHVLAVFGARPDLRFREACGVLGLDPAHTSRLIQKLVRRGLVAKVADSEDQRRIRIALTPRGRATHKVIHAAAAGLNEAWLASLPANDRTAFFATLDRLTAELRQLERTSRQPRRIGTRVTKP